MIHGGRAQLHGERHTRTLTELVAMHAHAESAGFACLQHAARLLLIEGTALTEDVDPLHVFGDTIEHRADDLIEVGFRFRSRRHEVRAEEGDVIDVAGSYPSGLNLGLSVEAIAGLRLQGRRTATVSGRNAFHEELFQTLLPRRAGGIHGYGDAAGLVGLTRHAGFELSGAVAVEDHVRMGIHPARQNCAPAKVNLFIRSRGLGGRADPGDGAVGVGDKGGVGKRAGLRHRAQL